METKERKEDRRTKYTRQVIKDTFLKLLEKKAYPKITVTEICKLAEINRGTFYLHYYDMDDVLDDILTDDPEARVLMCSAIGQESVIARAIQRGARDFIVKPFKEEALLKLVEASL